MNLLFSRYMMFSFVILMTVSCSMGKVPKIKSGEKTAEKNSVNETLKLISEATGKSVAELRLELDITQLDKIINSKEKSAELTEATLLRTSSIAIFKKAEKLTGVSEKVKERIEKSAKLAINTARQAELIATLIDLEKLKTDKVDATIEKLQVELKKIIESAKAAQTEATAALSHTTLDPALKTENTNRKHRHSGETARNEALKELGQDVIELSVFKERLA